MASAAESAKPAPPKIDVPAAPEVVDGGLPANDSGAFDHFEVGRAIFAVVAALVLLAVLVWLLYGDWRACFVRCRRSRWVQRMVGIGQQEESTGEREVDISLEEIVVGVVKHHQDELANPINPLTISEVSSEAAHALVQPLTTEHQDPLTVEGPTVPLAIEVISTDGEDWVSAASDSSL